MTVECDINGIPYNAPWNLVSLRYRGAILTGIFRHYCCEWDFLPIDESDEEINCCLCFEENLYHIDYTLL